MLIAPPNTINPSRPLANAPVMPMDAPMNTPQPSAPDTSRPVAPVDTSRPILTNTTTNIFNEASSGYHICTPAERDASMCSTMDSGKVCALLEDGINWDFDNGCKACATKTVISYYKGSCKRNCSEILSNDDCKANFDPVCGLTAEAGTTYCNACVACKKYSATHFYKGPCLYLCADNSTSINCPPVSNNLLTSNKNPICGITTENKHNIFANSCMACKQNSASTFFEGQCPKICAAADRTARNCPTGEGKWVCALSAEGKYFEYQTGCHACKDEKIISYSNGDCPCAGL